jgi:hypothetical protein
MVSLNSESWDSIFNEDNQVNIFRCSPWPEGAVWDKKPISFCPFCGCRVETELESPATLDK